MIYLKYKKRFDQKKELKNMMDKYSQFASLKKNESEIQLKEVRLPNILNVVEEEEDDVEESSSSCSEASCK